MLMATIKKDKGRFIIFLYFFILLTALICMQTKINEFKTNIKELIEENNQINETNKKLEETLNVYIKEKDEMLLKIEKLEENIRKLKIIRAKVTAYSPLDNRDGNQSQGNPSRTSTGRRVGKHIAAADPKRLPYGTKLNIPGYGIVEIQDTGGALRKDKKNIRIDLYYETFEQAINWGIKDLEVEVLEWGDK